MAHQDRTPGRLALTLALAAALAGGATSSALAEGLAPAASSSSSERQMVFQLADRADHPDTATRAAALDQLTRMRGDLALGAAARYVNDKDPAIRHAALDYIGAQRSRGSVAILGSLSAHPDETMRRDAIAWLGAQAHTDHRGEVAEALVPFLADPQRDVRLTAFAAVGETGDPIIVPQLARMYDVADPELRLAAVSTLGHVWDKSSADALVAFVDDGEPQVRQAAYRGLAQFGGSQSFELLVSRGLSDPDRETRLQVIGAVADLRLGASVEPLADAFHGADLEEKKVVVAALATIGTPSAQAALRDLNASGDYVEQVVVARVWSETRERVAAERAALQEAMSGRQAQGRTTIEVSIDPTYGVWQP